MDNIIQILLIAILLYGAWTQLTNGSGLLGERLPQKLYMD